MKCPHCEHGFYEVFEHSPNDCGLVNKIRIQTWHKHFYCCRCYGEWIEDITWHEKIVKSVIILFFCTFPFLAQADVLLQSKTYPNGVKSVAETYFFDTTQYEDGVYTFTVKAYDAAGNVGVDNKTFFICNTSIRVNNGPYKAYSNNLHDVIDSEASLDLRNISFSGDYAHSSENSTKLNGGFSCGYMSKENCTSLVGSLTIENGLLELDNICIK